jgi:BOP1NT (NUC169) domain
MHWYDEYPLLGYDWDGKPILKPERRDELDNFLKRMEDPNFWYFQIALGIDLCILNNNTSQENHQGSQHRPRCSFE